MPPARALLYAATLGVLVFVARAVLVEPPQLTLSIAVCVAYSTLFMAGVFSIRLRMFADAVVSGPKDARGVVLTFDDGPHPVHTRKVLDVLDAAGVKATFFVIAKKAEAQPELVREIEERGHAVGLHSYAHDRLFSLRSSSPRICSASSNSVPMAASTAINTDMLSACGLAPFVGTAPEARLSRSFLDTKSSCITALPVAGFVISHRDFRLRTRAVSTLSPTAAILNGLTG